MKFPFLAASLLVLAGLLDGCKAKPVAPPPQVHGVSAVTVISKDVPYFIDCNGLTVSSESVNIVSQVEGQIQALTFRQGSMVKNGDQLALIDPRPFQAAVDRALGLVESDEANLELARRALERNQKLIPQQLVSEHQMDTLESQVKDLAGQLKVDQAQLAQARINLGYTVITAPVDGMVGTYKINVGNVVKVNDAPITTIERMAPIYADFTVSVSDFPTLRKYFNQNSGKLRVQVSSLNESAETEDGELTILGNVIASTGTASLRATLANEKQRFWPNEPVRVRVFLDTLKDSILVPASAVVLSVQGPFVFVVRPSGDPAKPPTAEKRLVQIGHAPEDDMVIIASGLKAGEQVVTRGQIFLAPDQPVLLSDLDGRQLAPPPSAPPGAGDPSADSKTSESD